MASIGYWDLELGLCFVFAGEVFAMGVGVGAVFADGGDGGALGVGVYAAM